MIRRFNRAARAHGRSVRSVRRARTHGAGVQDYGREEGVVAASASDAAPAPHEQEGARQEAPAPSGRTPACPSRGPRHIFHRQTANNGPTPLGAPRTTGEPPGRGRAVPEHGQAGDRRNLAALAVSLAPACRCTPRLARSHRIINCLPSPPLLLPTLSSAAEVPALLYIYGAHWSGDTRSTPAT